MSLNLFLGKTASGAPIMVSNMSNPHIFITGQSGSGKSYFLKKLLVQASNQGAACLVFDYTGDYRSYMPPGKIDFKRISASSPEFTINPLMNPSRQSPKLLAQQLLGLIHGVFRLGNRVSLSLLKTTIAYLEAEPGVPTIGSLIDSIPPDRENGAILYILGCMDTLISCGDAPISLDLAAAGITVLDFSEIVDMQQRNLLVSLALNAIWMQRTTAPDAASAPPIILLLDEAQTLPWGQGCMAKRILCEGRKYGLAGWFAAQWISSREAASALEQAHLRIYFRPDDENISQTAKRLMQGSLRPPAECVQLLRSLGVGQFILRGQGGKLIKAACGQRKIL